MKSKLFRLAIALDKFALLIWIAILAAVLYGGSCSTAHAQETTATGNGSSFFDALQNAKVLATEHVASTFITGRQDLINGKYNEVLGQYNGGLIQKYEVLNTVVTSGMYAVTIRADVDTDKVNKIIVSNTTSTNDVVPHVEKAVDEFTKTANGWNAINDASNPFAITLVNTSYSVYDGRIVDVTYHFYMLWNAKWIDDAKQLTKAIGRSPVSGEGTYAVCFGRYPSDGGPCGGALVLPNTKYWAGIPVTATVHFKDGTTETHTLGTTAAQRLYSNRDVRIQLGMFEPIVTVEAVSFFKDEVAPFVLHLSFGVEKFKNVSEVTFTPDTFTPGF